MASSTVDRRDRSPATDSVTVTEVLAQAPPLILPALQAIQLAYGYVDEQNLATVAEHLNVSRAEVHGVLTFYKDLRTSAPGRTVVQVCRGEACQSMGANALVTHAQDSLGVGIGATTADGEVTLEEVFCLGNCALSPAIMTNSTLHGRVTTQRFDRLVNRSSNSVIA